MSKITRRQPTSVFSSRALLAVLVGLSVSTSGTLGAAEPFPDGDWAGLFPMRYGEFGTRFEMQERLVFVRIEKPRIAQPRSGPGPTPNGTLVLADRPLIQGLKRAREVIEKNDRARLDDAIEMLQRILDGDRDSFFQPDSQKKSQFRSLKKVAEELIGSIPKGATEPYELQFGVTARVMLRDAVAQGDPEGIAEVARRYFHTNAGYEAMFLMGVHHFDRSRPLAAAVCFDRLRQVPAAARQREPMLSLRSAVAWKLSGRDQRAQTILRELKQAAGTKSITVAGREHEWFAESDESLNWLATIVPQPAKGRAVASSSWTMYGENPARNPALTAVQSKIVATWQSSTIFDPTKFDPRDPTETETDRSMRDAVNSLAARIQAQKRGSHPRQHPLVVGETVLVRTAGTLRALDAQTGKVRWDTLADRIIERLLDPEAAGQPANRARGLSNFFAQRIWSDATTGTLSSDGTRVFSIDDVTYPIFYPTLDVYYGRPKVDRDPRSSRTNNRLTAYDFRTGELLWDAGGPPKTASSEFADAYFMGPPLSMGGQLYCIADVDGEVRLVVFNAEDGHLEWSQPLVAPRMRIDADIFRRLAGTAVSFQDGTLICPTAAGFVVAVDLTTRSLQWAYSYGSQSPIGPGPRPIPLPRPQPPGGFPQPGPRIFWAEPAAVIAGGNVFVAPEYSNEIHCLDLLDGTLKWRKSAPDGLFIAGAVDDRLILVGTQSVRALKLEDGTAAWKSPLKIDTPAGRGLIADGKLFLSLSTSQIIAVDLVSGEIVGTSKLPAGRRPGNLIAVGGLVLSQGIDSIATVKLPDVK